MLPLSPGHEMGQQTRPNSWPSPARARQTSAYSPARPATFLFSHAAHESPDVLFLSPMHEYVMQESAPLFLNKPAWPQYMAIFFTDRVAIPSPRWSQTGLRHVFLKPPRTSASLVPSTPASLTCVGHTNITTTAACTPYTLLPSFLYMASAYPG